MQQAMGFSHDLVLLLVSERHLTYCLIVPKLGGTIEATPNFVNEGSKQENVRSEQETYTITEMYGTRDPRTFQH